MNTGVMYNNDSALQPKIAKSIKHLILKVQGLSKSLTLIRLKRTLLVLVVIGSMPTVIFNRFHKRLANNGKMMTFTGVMLFDALACKFP